MLYRIRFPDGQVQRGPCPPYPVNGCELTLDTATRTLSGGGVSRVLPEVVTQADTFVGIADEDREELAQLLRRLLGDPPSNVPAPRKTYAVVEPMTLAPGTPVEWWRPTGRGECVVVGEIVRDDGGETVLCLPKYFATELDTESVPRLRLTVTP